MTLDAGAARPRAVVCLSGGMDSCVCAALAAREFEVYALHFSYGDSSGYPDCRPAYYEAFNRLVAAGTKEGTIRVVTPLIAMRKSEIVRLGVEVGAPLHVSWSCYSGETEACGVCESCALRLQAFRQAGLTDPIAYAAL